MLLCRCRTVQVNLSPDPRVVVDQERIGGDVRSIVGTATDADADAMLRILWSRMGEPRVGPPSAFSFNLATVSGAGAVTVQKGGATTTEKRSLTRLGGMCPRCEERGQISDCDLTALDDDWLSINEGALTVPNDSVDGRYWRIFRGCGFVDPDKPIRRFTKGELRALLYKEPTRITVEGVNVTYEGLIPGIEKSMLSCRRL